MKFLALNWANLFVPTLALAEILVRGTVTYLALFIMLRVILKREAGTVGITDLLVIVLIADAAQNAMSGGYHSITDGLLLVAVILTWSYTLDWLGSHFDFFSRLLRPPPLLLVQDGEMLRHNMRRELITSEELMSELRQYGVEDIREVRRMYMEGNGQFSVIRKDDQEVKRKDRTPSV